MNLHYSLLIQWSEEDQKYIVSFPEFRGAHTHGSTYKEAAKHGQEVLELLVESYEAERRPLPAPQTYDSSVPAR